LRAVLAQLQEVAVALGASVVDSPDGLGSGWLEDLIQIERLVDSVKSEQG